MKHYQGSPLSQKQEVDKKKSFFASLEKVNLFLDEIVTKNTVKSISLKELGSLQTMKILLDKLQYLNVIYDDNLESRYLEKI